MALKKDEKQAIFCSVYAIVLSVILIFSWDTEFFPQVPLACMPAYVISALLLWQYLFSDNKLTDGEITSIITLIIDMLKKAPEQRIKGENKYVYETKKIRVVFETAQSDLLSYSLLARLRNNGDYSRTHYIRNISVYEKRFFIYLKVVKIYARNCSDVLWREIETALFDDDKMKKQKSSTVIRIEKGLNMSKPEKQDNNKSTRIDLASHFVDDVSLFKKKVKK